MNSSMKKQLSIVIPTYNRAYVLKFTLSLLVEQVSRHLEDVDFIVCDNASNDDTQEIMKTMCSTYPFVQYIIYKDHVEVGDSIKRSASNAKGKYLLLWSDDDIPSQFLVDMVLDTLKRHPDLGCLCFNRIEGDSQDVLPIKSLYLTRKDFYEFEEKYDDSSTFIEKYFCDMSFMSQNVINMDCWNKGSENKTEGFWGFEFMIPLLAGLRNKQCLYLGFPLCIERHPSMENHSYANKWPLYIYIGIPRILIYLESIGIINDWKKCYSNYHYANSTFAYLKQVYFSFTKDIPKYQPMKKEIVSYQTHPVRIHYTKMALSENFIFRTLSKIEFFFFYSSYRFVKKVASVFNILSRW